MAYLWILLIVALFYADRLRLLALDTKTLKCRYRLYALRDELRELVIDGKVDSKHWVFQYLDSSIAKTIAVLRHVTVWHSILFYLFHRRDPRYQAAARNLARELKKQSNAELRRVHEKYAEILGTHLVRRHRASLGVVFSPLVTFAAIATLVEYLRGSTARLKEALTELPETSTLHQYAPR